MEESDSAELWRLTMEHSPVGMAIVGLDGRMLTANRSFCTMLGYDLADLRTYDFQTITHPDDLAADLELVRQTLAGDIDTFRMRKRYVHSDGHVVWVDLWVGLVRAADGRPLHFVSQAVDITEQRRMEALLEQAHAETEHERQTLEAIFDTVPVGLLLIDKDGRYQRMNPRHRETMHLPFPGGHQGAAGQLGQVYHLDGRTMTREEMPSYRATQGEEFDDYTYWAGDGRARAAFSASARQVRAPTGEVTGAVIAYQDVTELIRALQVKDDFVSSVSHELRTPLTAVLGHLEMLCEDDRLPRDVVSRLRVTQRNAARLSTLVSDLLTVAQTQQRSLSIAPARVDLAGLVREAVLTMRPWAEQAGVDIHLDAPDHLAAHLDAGRIRQVVDNLLSNGVKYTGAGGTVTVVLGEEDDRAHLAVSDTGIGIAADEIDRVFSRFFRGGEAREKHIPGTGIGLSIVSAIVAAHAGEITVTSEPGTGTTFRVVLPRDEQPACGGPA